MPFPRTLRCCSVTGLPTAYAPLLLYNVVNRVILRYDAFACPLPAYVYYCTVDVRSVTGLLRTCHARIFIYVSLPSAATHCYHGRLHTQLPLRLQFYPLLPYACRVLVVLYLTCPRYLPDLPRYCCRTDSYVYGRWAYRCPHLPAGHY